jgi:hypothetical protein
MAVADGSACAPQAAIAATTVSHEAGFIGCSVQ